MDFDPANKICSFCGRQGTKKTKFAGGLGAMICLDCLEYYHEIVSSKKRVAAMSKPPWEEMSDTDLLAKLPLILRSAEQNTEFVAEWVELIRQRKISWAEIGKVLGVSRQAAWERFAAHKSATDDDTITA